MKQPDREPQTKLERWEVHAFLNNTQVALADDTISLERINYLAAFANNLEIVLTKHAKLTPDELAFVFVSAAFNLKFPGGKP